jgi:hypothetical protein
LKATSIRPYRRTHAGHERGDVVLAPDVGSQVGRLAAGGADLPLDGLPECRRRDRNPCRGGAQKYVPA